jgi:hypothetical protein
MIGQGTPLLASAWSMSTSTSTHSSHPHHSASSLQVVSHPCARVMYACTLSVCLYVLTLQPAESGSEEDGTLRIQPPTGLTHLGLDSPGACPSPCPSSHSGLGATSHGSAHIPSLRAGHRGGKAGGGAPQAAELDQIIMAQVGAGHTIAA